MPPADRGKFAQFRATFKSVILAYADVFLMPQDFDLADANPVHKPTPAELDAMQNSALFEGDIVGIPPADSFRRMHDDVDDAARIFGQPVGFCGKMQIFEYLVFQFHSSLNVDTYADKLWENGRIPYLLEEGMTPTWVFSMFYFCFFTNKTLFKDLLFVFANKSLFFTNKSIA